MTFSTRDAQRMFQQMPGGDVLLQDRMGRLSRLAQLAYVAEQFGFAYGEAQQTGNRNRITELHLYRDPSQEAQARAAATMQQFPTAGQIDAPLPGMSPAGKGKWKPEPVAQSDVELLKARINFDLTGRKAEKRMLWGAVGLTAAAVLNYFRDGGGTGALEWEGITWAILMVLLGIGWFVTRKRNDKFLRRLKEAGLTQIRVGDEIRWLKPGQQLQGHANPLAGQFAPQQQAPQFQQQPQPPQPYAAQPPQQQPYPPQPADPYAGQQQPYPPQQPQAYPDAQPAPQAAPGADPRQQAYGNLPPQPQQPSAPQPPANPYSSGPDPRGGGNPYR